MKFAGKIICITGAASGIGRCMVLEFGKRAARLVAVDRDKESLDRLADECRREGIDLKTHLCDITNSDALHSTIDTIITDESCIDIWINNAGIAINHRMDMISLDDYRRSIAVNLTALIDATQYVVPRLQARGTGMIVNIGSVAGHIASPYMSAYTATKHAVVGFTRSLQAELEFDDSPVRAVLVSPGFVETSMIRKGAEMGFPEWMGWMLDRPEKVALSIVQGIQAGKSEIYPNLNGKTMIAAHRIFPKWTVKSSRILLTGSFKDFLLNRYRSP